MATLLRTNILLYYLPGVPAQTEHLKLDFAVTYNTLLFSLSCARPNETKDCIINILIRGEKVFIVEKIYFADGNKVSEKKFVFSALEAVHKQVPSCDLVPLWQVVLEAFCGTVHEPWIHKLLLIQWAVWLSERHYGEILDLLLQVNHKVCNVEDNHLTAFEQDRKSLVFKREIRDSVGDLRSMFNMIRHYMLLLLLLYYCILGIIHTLLCSSITSLDNNLQCNEIIT